MNYANDAMFHGGKLGQQVMGGLAGAYGNASVMDQDAKCVAKPSEVPEMMARLQIRMERLESAIQSLEVRLSPVMRAEPMAAGTAAPKESASTGLGNSLMEIGGRVESLDGKVCTMLRLLEL